MFSATSALPLLFSRLISKKEITHDPANR
jgi:hypothetical protein